MYNIKRENPFEGRLLVCKVAKRVIVFPNEWEVWKRFLQSVVSFSSVENLFLSFLKVSSFKVKVFGREFFKLLKTSTFKFESVCTFVFKMSFFQMESLKVMEKFDGGNFHLWKFKMRMMLSKHGLRKFVDGSATLPSEEVTNVDYNEKEMKAFALLCEHLTNAQLAHI